MEVRRCLWGARCEGSLMVAGDEGGAVGMKREEGVARRAFAIVGLQSNCL